MNLEHNISGENRTVPIVIHRFGMPLAALLLFASAVMPMIAAPDEVAAHAPPCHIQASGSANIYVHGPNHYHSDIGVSHTVHLYWFYNWHTEWPIGSGQFITVQNYDKNDFAVPEPPGWDNYELAPNFCTQ